MASTNSPISHERETKDKTATKEEESKITEEMKKKLFSLARERQWEKVVDIYKANEPARKAKITKSGDTALHLAVSDGKDLHHVSELVKLVTTDELKMTNEIGYTPLHIAASMGNTSMCECIAEKDSSLVGASNEENETPLFLAALYGQKDAFLCLHRICTPRDGDPRKYEYCRRKDGDTILHCAINGDYFDLAFQIIRLYGKRLVNAVNEKGATPLHVLAAKPSAFRSGSHLRRSDKIIYHCIYVDELQASQPDNQGIIKTFKEETDPKYPENYQTCMNFYRFFSKMIHVVTVKPASKTSKSEDTENPKATNTENPKATSRGSPGSQGTDEAQGHQSFPDNYSVCFEFVKLFSKAMLIVLGLGSTGIRNMRKKKEKHVWSAQIMNELLKDNSTYEYESESGATGETSQKTDNGETSPYDQLVDSGNIHKNDLDEKTKSEKTPAPINPSKDNQPQDNKNVYLICKCLCAGQDNQIKQKKTPMDNKETPLLIAAKNGVTEMVDKILELFPMAIHDMNTEKKNIVLLAVENRQPHVYERLLINKNIERSIFRHVDDKGNSALHLAAKLGEHRPWLIPGAALQMQWEIKWYEYVKFSMPLHFFVRNNHEGQTAKDVFNKTHTEIVKAGGQWLTNTSQSCSVVAALIATVAFASSTTFPGGINGENGKPTFANKPPFDIFAISSLVALCFSVTSMVMFLAILTSRYEDKDFGKDLPRKLIVGLTSLFVSIASMLVSFCSGHFFVLEDKLRYAVFPVYGITCLPVTFFAVAQFPLYVDLVWATFKKVPTRTDKVAPL